MQVNSGHEFVKDIHKNGLTSEVIERHKANFPQMNLLITKINIIAMDGSQRGRFIQVNECIMSFERDKYLFQPPCFFPTTAPFPTDAQIAELLTYKDTFYKVDLTDGDDIWI